MAEPDKRPVTLEELLVSSLAQTDALAKLLIEKGQSPKKSSCRRFQRNGRRIKGYLIPRPNERRCRRRRRAMRCVLKKSTRHLMWRIRTLALIIIVFVLGSTSVFARGGGHSGGARSLVIHFTAMTATVRSGRTFLTTPAVIILVGGPALILIRCHLLVTSLHVFMSQQLS